jgi:hypothetical protein
MIAAAQLKSSDRSLDPEPDASFYCRITNLARTESDLYRACYRPGITC